MNEVQQAFLGASLGFPFGWYLGKITRPVIRWAYRWHMRRKVRRLVSMYGIPTTLFRPGDGGPPIPIYPTSVTETENDNE